MEGAGSSSSSKVIIQCSDPSNLLDVFEPRLSVRTPLKNLHWKSPNRPLRSIPSLNISITRDDRLHDGQKPSIRRHQIPGLRETPYVKIYLLRCDDKELYKEKVRKEVRQWVKENTPSKDGKASSKTQEYHDAAEWMIVHVVLPDTPAASQPRSSKHISVEAAESTDSLNSKSKWTGKSSSTIYDKLRADFNSGSKSQTVRVAQVRITEPGRPTGALSVTEIEEQWQEFIENLKACILRSFDTRVTQYEEDIRERESQRKLPGWNFCTFFILKEGLARGFENVGLLDDALVVYEELEAGLDAVVKEHADQDDMESSGGLLPYSTELKNIIRAAIEPSQTPETDPSIIDKQPPTMESLLDSDKDKFPFDIEKRNYRDLILANKVSALDFRIFMFTRKMEIQIRRAYGPAAPTGRSISTLNSPTCNLDIMANLAESALNFINLASRELRSDLYNAWGGRLSGKERVHQRIVISNIVAIWTWVAIMQILSYTLPGLDIDISVVASSHISTFDLQVSEPEPSEERNPRASFRGGLSNPPSATSTPRQLSRARSQQREHSSVRYESDTRINGTGVATRPGSIRLSAWAARLLLLARKVLEELPAARPYVSSLFTNSRTWINAEKHTKVNSISSREASPESEGKEELELEMEDGTKSLGSRPLLRAIASEEYFDELFYFLSKCARYFLVSGKNYRAAKQVMVEIARAAYSRKDYDSAVEYLGDLLNGPQQFSATQVQPYLLEMYANCLQDREDTMEYCRCLLKCLSIASRGLLTSSVQWYVDELVGISEMVEPMTIPMTDVLDTPSMSTSISHYPDRDGFFLCLNLKARFSGKLKIGGGSKLSICSTDGSDPAKIILECTEDLVLGSQATVCMFGSTCTTRGWYELEELKMEIGNICLSHIFLSNGTTGIPHDADRNLQINPIPRYFLYPRWEAVSVKTTSGTHVSLGKPQHLTIALNSGANIIHKCSMRIRSATAGLRLHVHEARLDASDSVLTENTREGDVSKLLFEAMNANSTATFDVPYSMENSSEPTLIIKTDILYETDQGNFTFHQINSVDVILPISVNVQDFFRESGSISRFTIAPATLGPIFLIDCQVADSAEVNMDIGSIAHSITIFPKQPASWVVKHRKPAFAASQVQEKFTLQVRYQCIDELILNAFETAFTQDLVKTPYAYLNRLLTPHLLYTLKQTWTEQDLELAGLTQEIEPWKYNEQEWRMILSAVKPDERARLSEWLSTWHEFHEPLRFISNNAHERQLQLHVDAPPQPLTLITDLKLNHYPNRSEYIALGQPIPAMLIIETVTGYKQKVEENQSDFEMTYELVAPSDTWLIGGRKKGNIDLATLPMKVPITILPQRIGYLLLPSIDIRARKRDEQDTTAISGWVDVPIEVQTKTISKALFVLANLSSTTIGMSFDDESSHGPGWVIDGQHWDSEQRTRSTG